MFRATFLLAALAAGLLNATAQAGDCGCCNCGNHHGVRKVCRLVCDTKEISTYCYGCKCEDICLPGKSCRGCLHSDCVCGEDCPEDCCDHRPLCHLEWFDWKPSCAKVRTVKKLVKYELTREIPSWKWVVEEVCCDCCPQDCCEPGMYPGDPEIEVAPPAGPDAPFDEAPLPPQANRHPNRLTQAWEE